MNQILHRISLRPPVYCSEISSANYASLLEFTIIIGGCSVFSSICLVPLFDNVAAVNRYRWCAEGGGRGDIVKGH